MDEASTTDPPFPHRFQLQASSYRTSHALVVRIIICSELLVCVEVSDDLWCPEPDSIVVMFWHLFPLWEAVACAETCSASFPSLYDCTVVMMRLLPLSSCLRLEANTYSPALRELDPEYSPEPVPPTVFTIAPVWKGFRNGFSEVIEVDINAKAMTASVRMCEAMFDVVGS